MRPGNRIAGNKLAACAAALFLGCVICDFFYIRANPINSDTVQNYNEIRTFMAGNVRLHGWYLATNNYYLTDLPFYVLSSLALGDRPALIYLVPFGVFVLLLVASILIVRRAAKSAAQRDVSTLAVIILLGFPFASPQVSLVVSGVHGATLMLALYGFLSGQQLLDAARPNRLWLLPFGLVVFAVAGSDPQADAYFIAPLILLVVIRLWLHVKFRADEWLLAGTAMFATGLGIGLIRYLGWHGGFQLEQNYALTFVASLQAVTANAQAVLRAIQMLFDARPEVLQRLWLYKLIAFSRFATMILVAALCLRVAWRAPREPQSALSQWLVLGAFCLMGLDVMSGMFAAILFGKPDTPDLAIRYVAPAYVLMSVAAILEAQTLPVAAGLGRRVPGAAGALFSALFLCGALQAGVKAALATPATLAAPQFPITVWLLQHGLHYGVGDYWTTQMVTALSQGRVTADPVIVNGGRLAPFFWVDDMSNLQAGHRPQFVVYMPGNGFGVDLNAVRATYKPQDIKTVAGYVVVILKR